MPICWKTLLLVCGDEAEWNLLLVNPSTGIINFYVGLAPQILCFLLGGIGIITAEINNTDVNVNPRTLSV